MEKTTWKANAQHEGEFDLIRKHLAGDALAFESLMLKYRPRILRLAGGILHNTWDADDACQMIFLKVHQNLHRFEFRASFGAWLYRLSYNETLNVLRRLRRERLGRQRAEAFAPAPPVPATPAEQALADLRRDRVLTLLETLPPSMQDVLVSIDVIGIAPEEAAQTLGVRLTTLRVRRHRAFRRLATAFADVRESLLTDPVTALQQALAAA